MAVPEAAAAVRPLNGNIVYPAIDDRLAGFCAALITIV